MFSPFFVCYCGVHMCENQRTTYRYQFSFHQVSGPVIEVIRFGGKTFASELPHQLLAIQRFLGEPFLLHALSKHIVRCLSSVFYLPVHLKQGWPPSLAQSFLSLIIWYSTRGVTLQLWQGVNSPDTAARWSLALNTVSGILGSSARPGSKAKNTLSILIQSPSRHWGGWTQKGKFLLKDHINKKKIPVNWKLQQMAVLMTITWWHYLRGFFSCAFSWWYVGNNHAIC